MSLICLSFWGPLPLACLWVGGRTQYLTDSIFGGLAVAFATMIGCLLLGLMALKRLDYMWILIRRAAGHDQREGMIGRIFMICCVIAVPIFGFWFTFLSGANMSGLSVQNFLGSCAATSHGPARLLPAVRRDDRRGGHGAAARAGRGTPPPRARPDRGARPVAHDVARAPAPGRRQRRHVPRARRGGSNVRRRRVPKRCPFAAARARRLPPAPRAGAVRGGLRRRNGVDPER